MKKLILAAVLLMIIATLFVFSNSSVSSTTQTVSDTKKNELTTLAQKEFNKQKAAGVKMDSGPCLGKIAVGWVADVIHNPRIEEDDKPANQCTDYRNGTVKNYIELDISGNFVSIH